MFLGPLLMMCVCVCGGGSVRHGGCVRYQAPLGPLLMVVCVCVWWKYQAPLGPGDRMFAGPCPGAVSRIGARIHGGRAAEAQRTTGWTGRRLDRVGPGGSTGPNLDRLVGGGEST